MKKACGRIVVDFIPWSGTCNQSWS